MEIERRLGEKALAPFRGSMARFSLRTSRFSSWKRAPVAGLSGGERKGRLADPVARGLQGQPILPATASMAAHGEAGGGADPCDHPDGAAVLGKKHFGLGHTGSIPSAFGASAKPLAAQMGTDESGIVKKLIFAFSANGLAENGVALQHRSMRQQVDYLWG